MMVDLEDLVVLHKEWKLMYQAGEHSLQNDRFDVQCRHGGSTTETIATAEY
jgi:hypothetical protein